jgi:hypothetical protein
MIDNQLGLQPLRGQTCEFPLRLSVPGFLDTYEGVDALNLRVE